MRQSQVAATAAEVADAQVNAARKTLAAAQAKLEMDRKAVAKAQAEHDNAVLKRELLHHHRAGRGHRGRQVGRGGPGGGRRASPCAGSSPCPTTHIWVDANFKETQLHRIKPGQPVTLTVDAVADHEFQGTVGTLSAGTGAAFALLPPENASGNWVKIVQRLPVRIDLAPGDPLIRRLRLGLSAEVTVDTREPGER